MARYPSCSGGRLVSFHRVRLRDLDVRRDLAPRLRGGGDLAITYVPDSCRASSGTRDVGMLPQEVAVRGATTKRHGVASHLSSRSACEPRRAANSDMSQFVATRR